MINLEKMLDIYGNNGKVLEFVALECFLHWWTLFKPTMKI